MDWMISSRPGQSRKTLGYSTHGKVWVNNIVICLRYVLLPLEKVIGLVEIRESWRTSILRLT